MSHIFRTLHSLHVRDLHTQHLLTGISEEGAGGIVYIKEGAIMVYHPEGIHGAPDNGSISFSMFHTLGHIAYHGNHICILTLRDIFDVDLNRDCRAILSFMSPLQDQSPLLSDLIYMGIP